MNAIGGYFELELAQRKTYSYNYSVINGLR